MSSSSTFQQLRHARSLLSNSVVLPFAAVVLAMAAIVSPIADFPLNDDWVYAEIVRELIDAGMFYEHPYRGSLAITSSLWGALFASVFGLSYTVLRCSTLVLALVSICATTKAAAEHGLSRSLAFLCGALLIANPIFLNLAYTFMGDVPGVAAASCAGLFYMRALTRRKAWDAFWGSVFVVLGTATRQDGVVVIGAFAATEVVSWIRGADKPDLRFLTAFALPLFLGGLIYMLAFAGSSEQAFNNLPRAGAEIGLLASLPGIVFDACAALTYMGLFTLPIAIAKLVAIARGDTVRTRGQWIAFAGVCIALQLASTSIEGDEIILYRMPLLPNILYDLGTGPLTLRDVFAMGPGRPEGIGDGWWIIQALSVGSVALLLVDVVPGLVRHVLRIGAPAAPAEDEAKRARTLFLALWVAAIVLLPYRLVTEMLYDRYLLPTLLPVAILAAGSLVETSRRGRRIAWIGTALAFLFSLFCVQDYLAWNSARWQAIDHLRFERGVGEKEIDGGYEYNGAYLSAEFRERHDVTSFWAQGPDRFWLLEETKYAICMNEVPGCSELMTFEYFSWLRMETRKVRAVHCSDGPTP